jgi:hypothetical protein
MCLKVYDGIILMVLVILAQLYQMLAPEHNFI